MSQNYSFITNNFSFGVSLHFEYIQQQYIKSDKLFALFVELLHRNDSHSLRLSHTPLLRIFLLIKKFTFLLHLICYWFS